ncbi:MAG: beta-lactamase-like protein [Chthonomonadaceae bacterium]|nr:beta-lactamase-like protein [Chthonomonadaceae bacterium]
MEIRPGIHRIESRFAGRYLFQHVLVGDRVLVMDTGVPATPATVLFPYLASIGRAGTEIDYVVCTHPDADHLGGNSAVRAAAPSCRILGHALDVHWLEDPDAMVAERYDGFRVDHGIGDPPEALADARALCGEPTLVDIALRGGEWLALSDDWRVEILHTPGHSEGHLSVWDPRSRTLIIADAAMGRALPYVDGSPALAATYTHPRPYALTGERLREQGADLLLTAHFPVMAGEEIDRHLQASRALVDDVDVTIRQTIEAADRPIGLRELVDAVDRRLGPLPADTRDTWASPVAGHLNELEAAGDVIAGRDGDRKVYTLRRRRAPLAGRAVPHELTSRGASR